MRIPLFSLLSGLLICSAWADEVTLMLNPADRARPTWQRLSDEFNSTHAGIRFRIIWSDADAKMHLLAAADALPDLLILPDFQLVKYHSLLADLGPFVDSLPEVRGQIYPSLLGACEYGGALKLLPVYFNIPFVYYRPDLFREAGLPMPDERWTWEDYSREGPHPARAGRLRKNLRHEPAPALVGRVAQFRAPGGRGSCGLRGEPGDRKACDAPGARADA
jgi:ABC-type glycerol-3-phosphate transport system substrate-binding protein